MEGSTNVMDLVKKDGRLQQFDISKIKQSILNASRDIHEPLTDADIKVIENEVLKVLKVLNEEKTSSYEILGIVLHTLNKLGFSKIGKVYLNGLI
jgi:transcriptional regulator NrdR family protein